MATMGLQDSRSYVAGAWLAVRIIVGVEWLRASWHKIADAGWTEAPRGAAVEGYLQAAIAKAEEEIAFPAVQGWWPRSRRTSSSPTRSSSASW